MKKRGNHKHDAKFRLFMCEFFKHVDLDVVLQGFPMKLQIEINKPSSHHVVLKFGRPHLDLSTH
jgi:hypothetical protein